MTKQDLINKLQFIADHSGNNEIDNYDVVVADWEKYGKSRTYFKITRTRNASTMYQVKEYGYYDNVAEKYVVTNKYADLTKNYTFGGEIIDAE